MMPNVRFRNESRGVVLLSGGLDSCVLLALAQRQLPAVEALSISYGSTHAHAELVAADRIVEHLGGRRSRIYLPPFFGSSSLTDGQEASPVVPGRNAVLLMIATARCAAQGGGVVLIGCNADDAALFPDCRSDFIEAANETALLGSGGNVTVVAPFLGMPKSAVVQLGVELHAPLYLTYSCYRGTRPPCGECEACRVRDRAFNGAGVSDPALAGVA